MRHPPFDISDTGIGIEKEAIPHICEPFNQGSITIGQRFGGLGLGLAITKSIVEAHGGGLHVESAGIGEGVTFVLRLPLSIADIHQDS